MRALPALVVDIVAVLVFAILGRSSHDEANTLLGVLGTAWPFIAGALLGHLLCRVGPLRRAEPTTWRPALAVWASTLVVGLLLRLASGDTAAWPFVLVAGIVLAVFLFAWRGIVRLARRARSRTNAAA